MSSPRDPVVEAAAPFWFAGAYVLFILAARFAPNGSDPWLDGKQVKVGLFSTTLTTLAFVIASIAWAGAGGKTPFTWQSSFLYLPFLCQLVAMVTAVVAWTKLDELYGASSDSY